MQRLKDSGKHKNLQKPRLLQKPEPEASNENKQVRLDMKLFSAIEQGHLHREINNNIGYVKELLAQGADVGARDGEGWTPLTMAAFWGREDVCALFLESKADVNETDRYGRTPLMLASLQGDTSLCKFLLDKGADIGKKDQEGKTAFSWARGKEKTAEFLKEYLLRKLLGLPESVYFLAAFKDCIAA
jgi:ankyrin repeat protein